MKFGLLGMAVLVSCVGCATFTPTQKNAIAQAENLCSNPTDAADFYSIRVIPTWKKSEIDGITASMHTSIQGDAAVYLSLITQDLCSLTQIGNRDLLKWRSTVSKAFYGWQALPKEGTVNEQLDALNKSKAALLEEVDKLSDETMTPVDFDVFNKLLPKHNYLVVTNFTAKVGTDFIQGPLGANIDAILKPSQFSIQLRPALQNRRIRLATFALREASMKDTMRSLIGDIYESQAERVLSKPVPVDAK